MTEFNPLLGKKKIQLTQTDSSEIEEESSKPLLHVNTKNTEQEVVRYRPKSMSMISRSQYGSAEFYSATTTSHSSSTVERTSERPKSLGENTKYEAYVSVDKAEKLFIKSIATKPSQTQIIASSSSSGSINRVTVERRVQSISTLKPLVIEELTNNYPDPENLNGNAPDNAINQEMTSALSTITSSSLVRNCEDISEDKKDATNSKPSLNNSGKDEKVETSSVTSSSSNDSKSCQENVEPLSVSPINSQLISPEISSPIPPGEEFTIEINKGIHDLGINIIGGSNTVMRAVYILDVLDSGIAAKDGRLWPGDEIRSVNNHDLSTATHEQAIEVFRLSAAKVRLVVFRDGNRSKTFLRCQRKIKVPLLSYWDSVNNEEESDVYDLYDVHLKKKSNQSLGLCIIGRRNDPGVFIAEITPGSVASKEESINRGDQILAINGNDIKMAGQEVAAHLVKTFHGNVHLRMGRLKAGIPDDLMDMPMSGQPKASDVSKALATGYDREKQVTRFVEIEKPFNAPLGIYIAGGVGSPLGDIPVFVALIEESSVAGRKLKVGDIIASVNGQSTESKTHDEIVEMMNTAEDMIILMQVKDSTPEIQKLTSYLRQAVTKQSSWPTLDEKKTTFDQPNNIVSVRSKKTETIVY